LQDGSKVVGTSKPLSFDPIEEARRQWNEHGWEAAADGMAVVTSVFRAQQIYLARIDVVLRTFNLTFARFELLRLLSFTRSGSLAMNRLGSRLQVHPTSVTSTVDRLESQGLVRRLPHEIDRRKTLVEILPAGQRVVRSATAALNDRVFADPGVSRSDAVWLFSILRKLRESGGDFES